MESFLMHKIGVISDTHGMIRPEIAAVFDGVELIIHAGDVGSLLVMMELEKIAPVKAVFGNTDKSSWSQELPASAVVDIGGVQLYVLHSVAEMNIDPVAAGFAAVIHGHTHEQAQEIRDGVLYFNPGSAGARRTRLPASVGLITIDNLRVQGEIIPLPDTESARYY
jgi:putative phosphoesterase